MTNEDFLRQLEELLRDRLTQAELEEVSSYHRDYFSKEGPHAAQQLDPPEIIAQRVVQAYHPLPALDAPKPRRQGRTAALIALCAALLVGGLGLRYGVRHVLRQKVETSIEEVFPESMKQSVTILTVAREELPSFSSIRVESDAGAVTVRAGDKNAVTSESGHSWAYSVEDGVLTLAPTASHSGEKVELTLAESFLDEIEVDTDFGRILLEGISASHISLSTSAGNIDLIDCHPDSVELSTDMGSIFASLPGKQEDWSLELDADLGTVRVDGEKVRRSYSTNQGGFRLSAETNVGDISVQFVP